MGSPMSDESTIDRVLRYCQLHQIHTVTDKDLPNVCRRHGDGRTVRIGNIAFRANSHDTGCDVRGWIIDGDDAYEFVSTTYWYSSHYTFNSSKWERGAWDEAVNQFFGTLRAAKEKHEAELQASRERAAADQAKAAATHKARFERQFTSNN